MIVGISRGEFSASLYIFLQSESKKTIWTILTLKELYLNKIVFELVLWLIW